MTTAKDRVIEAARDFEAAVTECRYTGGLSGLAFRYALRREQECFLRLRAAFAALEAAPDDDGGWREQLGFGEIVMMSEQRNQPGLPPRWCALARDRKEAAYADNEEEARIAALALPTPSSPESQE